MLKVALVGATAADGERPGSPIRAPKTPTLASAAGVMARLASTVSALSPSAATRAATPSSRMASASVGSDDAESVAAGASESSTAGTAAGVASPSGVGRGQQRGARTPMALPAGFVPANMPPHLELALASLSNSGGGGGGGGARNSPAARPASRRKKVNKANVDAFTPLNMYTALHYAASFGHLECVQLLLKNNAKTEVRTLGRCAWDVTAR